MPTAPRQFRLYSQPVQWKSPDTLARCRHYRTQGWARIRERIITRDMMVCQICGTLCTGKKNRHVDHIRAVVDGGDDSDGNLRLLCQSCHSRRTLRDNQ
jgi:5-methylcytosine-specific restriction endonuclease McrA